MVAHIFNYNNWEAESGYLCEMKGNLVYGVSASTTKDAHKNLVSKNQKLKKNKRNRV